MVVTERGLERSDQDHLMTPDAFHTLVATRVSEVISDSRPGKQGILRVPGFNPFDAEDEEGKYRITVNPNNRTRSFVEGVFKIQQDLRRHPLRKIPWPRVAEEIRREREELVTQIELFSARNQAFVDETLREFIS